MSTLDTNDKSISPRKSKRKFEEAIENDCPARTYFLSMCKRLVSLRIEAEGIKKIHELAPLRSITIHNHFFIFQVKIDAPFHDLWVSKIIV